MISSSRFRTVASACAALLALAASSDSLTAQPRSETERPDTLIRDFDRDGIQERLISSPATNVIHRWDESSKKWIKADYALPSDVSLVDATGRRSGLQFVDLNGDGFDDILYSSTDRYAIHLWTKIVRLDLGWTKGWSQFVRSGRRAGVPSEPPILSGADVRVDAGDLVVTQPAIGGKAGSVERRKLKDLIAIEMPPPRSPQEGLASLRVRKGFRVELIASEPVVIDPVSFDWGADGRLWVVEMRDYPLGMDGQGKPGGVVKVLEDTDADGRYDKAIPFVEGIGFPSSVMPWRKGALIAAAPDLIYAEDTDGDGRADVRTILLTGFTPGNQQHRFNGFEWGLDGWIYVANGDSGGTVKSLKTGKSLSISGRDIRFKPDTGELETISAQTQYGRRRDDWGNWFGNNNPTWLWHVPLPEHYLRRNPKLAVKRVSHVLANYEDSTRVFPSSPPMVRPNQPWSLNHVTSGCSPTPYRDDLFGPAFATTVFASEPVHNVVHREVLVPSGSGFSSHRAEGEERSEFLASTDNWFRPITTRTGPDGALYVADMYRFSLEHPEWISPETLARLDTRAGSDKGRLYRVLPEGAPRRSVPNLAVKSNRELVAAMDSVNGWQRDMAQRLLLERNDPSTHEQLRGLLTLTHAPHVRLQALATLGLLKALSLPTLLASLDDPHPGVRCEALRQSEALTDQGPGLFQAVAALAADGVGSVRFQAAFSLGAWPAAASEPVLGELATRADADEWLRVAIQSSLRPESALFARLKAGEPVPKAASLPLPLKPSTPDRAQVLESYSGVGKLQGESGRGHKQFLTLCAPCHRLRGEGSEVGPDLGMAGTKPLDWLLTAILDPSQAVEARYRAWAITLNSGEVLTGLVSAETGNNLVLRLPGSIDHPVLRSDIASMTASPLSLMPVGFESALKPQDMADLLAWLTAP